MTSKTETVFLLQITRLYKYLEGLNSSLAHFDGKL